MSWNPGASFLPRRSYTSREGVDLPRFHSSANDSIVSHKSHRSSIRSSVTHITPMILWFFVVHHIIPPCNEKSSDEDDGAERMK
jgi:hypothetical protein